MKVSPLGKSLALLIAAPVLLWAVLACPAYFLGGNSVLLQSAAALAICLLPVTVSLLLLGQSMKADANTQMVAILAGTGIRVAITLGAGMFLTYQWPGLFPKPFWFWVGLFYLTTLVLETLLAVGNARETSGSKGSTAA